MLLLIMHEGTQKGLSISALCEWGWGTCCEGRRSAKPKKLRGRLGNVVASMGLKWGLCKNTLKKKLGLVDGTNSVGASSVWCSHWLRCCSNRLITRCWCWAKGMKLHQRNEATPGYSWLRIVAPKVVSTRVCCAKGFKSRGDDTWFWVKIIPMILEDAQFVWWIRVAQFGFVVIVLSQITLCQWMLMAQECKHFR